MIITVVKDGVLVLIEVLLQMKQKDVGLRVSEHDEIDHEKLASTNPNPNYGVRVTPTPTPKLPKSQPQP